MLLSPLDHRIGVFTQNTDGKGIGEDAALFQHLVSGAM